MPKDPFPDLSDCATRPAALDRTVGGRLTSPFAAGRIETAGRGLDAFGTIHRGRILPDLDPHGPCNRSTPNMHRALPSSAKTASLGPASHPLVDGISNAFEADCSRRQDTPRLAPAAEEGRRPRADSQSPGVDVPTRSYFRAIGKTRPRARKACKEGIIRDRRNKPSFPTGLCRY